MMKIALPIWLLPASFIDWWIEFHAKLDRDTERADRLRERRRVQMTPTEIEEDDEWRARQW